MRSLLLIFFGFASLLAFLAFHALSFEHAARENCLRAAAELGALASPAFFSGWDSERLRLSEPSGLGVYPELDAPDALDYVYAR